LRDYKTFRIFVYADEQSKIARCRARATEDENLTDKQLLKKINQIDKNRKSLHDLFSSSDWGARESYDLMINTSRTEIKTIIPQLAELIKTYYGTIQK
jgi:cytidylate kinase